MLTLFYSFWIDSPDYTIKIVGSTIYAIPRSNTTLPLFVGTDAYTVIDSAVNRLTISGAGGSGGGEIDIMQGNYSLTNEITITGWEGGGSKPHSYLKIKGVGYATKIVQTTSGKNAFVIKNDAGVVMEDMYIFAGSAAKSCIFGDSSGTSEISIWGGYFNNLFLESNSTSSPALFLKNFFDVDAPHLTVSNSGNWGTVLQNSSTTVNYGNSHFGFLRSEGKATYPLGGLGIKSINNTHYIDQVSIDNFECTQGYYGLATDYANFCTVLHCDIETPVVCIGLGVLTTGSGNRTSTFSFHGGYLLPGASDTAISVAVSSGGNTFEDIWVEGTSTIPVIDAGNSVAPNSFSLIYGNSVNSGGVTIANSNSSLKYRANNGATTTTKLAGTTTATTSATTDNSTNIATTAFVNSFMVFPTQRIAYFESQGNSTTFNQLGLGMNTQGTTTQRNVATTSFNTEQRRTGFVGATTANAKAGGQGNPQFLVDLGFTYRAVFSIQAYNAGHTYFVGMVSSYSATINGGAQTQCIGMYFNPADANWSVIGAQGSAGTGTSLGSSFPATTSATDVYDFQVTVAAGATTGTYKITRLNTGATASGTITTVPQTGNMLQACAIGTNLATGVAASIDIMRIYVITAN